MAIDRRQKKKKKREQKKKQRRQNKTRQQRYERSEEYMFLASEAFLAGDYEKAFRFAIKRLKVVSQDDHAFEVAFNCARFLDDENLLYELFSFSWEKELLFQREDYFYLAYLAVERKEYQFARQIYRELKNATVPMERPLTKKQQKDLNQYLEWVEYQIHIQQNRNDFEKLSKELLRKQLSESKASQTEATTKVEESEEAEILLEPEIHYKIDPGAALTAIQQNHQANLSELELTLTGLRLSFRTSYDQLLCLPTLQNVQSLWYQQETARKVMKNFRGRAILADEVGLGKTIEACLVLKEYLMRGLVKTVLILTPSSLVNQWQAELRDKFGLDFITSNDAIFREDPERFWASPQLIVSINTAKSKRNFDKATSRVYDLVIADEAHHLKNRRTLNWKLVNALQKTFLLLLTATPVENKLEELFNLVTLLVPGHLKTRKAFMEEFVSRGNPTDPQNREKLRQLLREVMLRNTRSVTQVHLPPRFATTIKVGFSSEEMAFWEAVNAFIVEQANQPRPQFSKQSLQRLLTALGSSPMAVLRMLERMKTSESDGLAKKLGNLIRTGRAIKLAAKTEYVLELITADSEKKLLFVNYVASLDYLQQVLSEHRIPHVIFRGGMSAAEKQTAIDLFREEYPLLLSTGVGGEGQNLQFCHTLINYDLPWNPMEIEQRIGRVHRIGQENAVQIYNFCAEDSLEAHILEVLDRKINMFELVIGEIDMILGRMRGEQEFSEMVYDIWVKNQDVKERKKAFNSLATRLKRAQNAYQKSKELDEKLFKEDFGV